MQKSKKPNETSTEMMEYKIQKWLVFISLAIMCISVAVLPFVFPSEDLSLQRFNIQTLFTATDDLEKITQDHDSKINNIYEKIKELDSKLNNCTVTDRKHPKQ